MMTEASGLAVGGSGGQVNRAQQVDRLRTNTDGEGNHHDNH